MKSNSRRKSITTEAVAKAPRGENEDQKNVRKIMKILHLLLICSPIETIVWAAISAAKYVLRLRSQLAMTIVLSFKICAKIVLSVVSFMRTCPPFDPMNSILKAIHIAANLL